MHTSDITEIVNAGCTSLFEQFRYSNGFTSVGQSVLAEAALVCHIAAAAISRGHAVWPESPFRTAKRGRTKRLDLLIHANPASPDVHVVCFEGKTVSKGFETKKVGEIIADHERVIDWRLLEPDGKPIYFSIDPPRSVSGVLAVLLTEEPDLNSGGVMPLSEWWLNPAGSLACVSTAKAAKLRALLGSAYDKNVRKSSYSLGRTELYVAYAIFNDTVSNEETLQTADAEHTAHHEAAHAVVALLFGFSVHSISLHDAGPHAGSVCCDWKASRGSISDDDVLVRAFAVAYAGAAVDVNRTGKTLSECLYSLPTDVGAITDIRATAAEWGGESQNVETALLSTRGFELAVTMIEQNEDLVAWLADELLTETELDRDAIAAWQEEVRSVGEWPDIRL